MIDHLIAERERAALLAARINPPDYIVKELGERPSAPDRRQRWDRAVREIEGYRQRHGVRDREHALGREPSDRSERRAWETQSRKLREQRQRIERGQSRERTADRGIELGR